MIDSNKSSGRRVDRSRLEIGSKKKNNNGRKIIIVLLLTALSSGMGNDHDDDEIVKKVPIKMLWRETQLKGDLLSRFIFDTNLTIQVSCSTIYNSIQSIVYFY